ncbi:MAG: DUF3109 family protein [Bacteroidota bacterium]|nr:DUF3109 family protein [Bacteroidota bacterium]
MIQIDDKIVSLEVIEEKFVCDIPVCKGMCCVYGDSGAPLEDGEEKEIERIYSKFKPYLRKESIKEIEKQGFSLVDSDGDLVTPLINKEECVYAYFENGIAKCAIETAYFDKKVKFRKPISCQLYPIRTKKIGEYEAINFHSWDVCKPAFKLGREKNVPVYKFLKEPLIRKYGKKWYADLELAAEEYLKTM